jgi:hypothetical protein
MDADEIRARSSSISARVATAESSTSSALAADRLLARLRLRDSAPSMPKEKKTVKRTERDMPMASCPRLLAMKVAFGFWEWRRSLEYMTS